MKQFNRVAKCVLGTLDLGEVSFAFDVKKTASAAANTCKLQIRNLKESNRRALEGKPALPIDLFAGYGDAVKVFSGTLRKGQSGFSGADILTELECADSEEALSTKRISATISPGESAADVATRAAEALGLGLGNLASALTALAGRRSLFPSGGAVFGSAANLLDRVCKAYGYTWSVQDGQLQILDTSATGESGELISARTGLIGSPKVDTKGHLNFECLMRPGLKVGESLVIDSAFVKGVFRVLEIEHKGDTYGDAWTSEVACDKP